MLTPFAVSNGSSSSDNSDVSSELYTLLGLTSLLILLTTVYFYINSTNNTNKKEKKEKDVNHDCDLQRLIEQTARHIHKLSLEGASTKNNVSQFLAKKRSELNNQPGSNSTNPPIKDGWLALLESFKLTHREITKSRDAAVNVASEHITIGGKRITFRVALPETFHNSIHHAHTEKNSKFIFEEDEEVNQKYTAYSYKQMGIACTSALIVILDAYNVPWSKGKSQIFKELKDNYMQRNHPDFSGVSEQTFVTNYIFHVLSPILEKISEHYPKLNDEIELESKNKACQPHQDYVNARVDWEIEHSPLLTKQALQKKFNGDDQAMIKGLAKLKEELKEPVRKQLCKQFACAHMMYHISHLVESGISGVVTLFELDMNAGIAGQKRFHAQVDESICGGVRFDDAGVIALQPPYLQTVLSYMNTEDRLPGVKSPIFRGNVEGVNNAWMQYSLVCTTNNARDDAVVQSSIKKIAFVLHHGTLAVTGGGQDLAQSTAMQNATELVNSVKMRCGIDKVIPGLVTCVALNSRFIDVALQAIGRFTKENSGVDKLTVEAEMSVSKSPVLPDFRCAHVVATKGVRCFEKGDEGSIKEKLAEIRSFAKSAQLLLGTQQRLLGLIERVEHYLTSEYGRVSRYMGDPKCHVDYLVAHMSRLSAELFNLLSSSSINMEQKEKLKNVLFLPSFNCASGQNRTFLAALMCTLLPLAYDLDYDDTKEARKNEWGELVYKLARTFHLRALWGTYAIRAKSRGAFDASLIKNIAILFNKIADFKQYKNLYDDVHSTQQEENRKPSRKSSSVVSLSDSVSSCMSGFFQVEKIVQGVVAPRKSM